MEEQANREDKINEKEEISLKEEINTKKELASEEQLRELDAKQLFEEIYNQPLNTKKNILGYIDEVKKLSKEVLSESQLQESYSFIESHIQEMTDTVKPNTIVYLKNELKTKLGKYAGVKLGRENAFLRFFKETYENEKKTKEYTWVLADLNRIREQQILDTLKSINAYCFKEKLSQGDKKDIFPMIARIVDTQNARYINQLKSMEGIRKIFCLKVIRENEKFIIKKGNSKINKTKK